jgi:hypothetical protein
MGLLEEQDIDNWRKGRVPYLEKVIKCNLAKASRIPRILYAHDLNLKPSLTVYRRKTGGGKIPYDFPSQVRETSKRRIRGIFLSWASQEATTLSTQSARSVITRIARDSLNE